MNYRIGIFAVYAALLQGALVKDVRDAIARNDYAGAEALIQAQGNTPESLVAYSWLGRGALAAKDYDKAERYADEAHRRALAELKKRPLDAENHLPIALGAAIEVRAQIKAARGERDQAVGYLQDELKRYYDTSIRTRIQKNINLLSLEGKPAPPLDTGDVIGPKFDMRNKPTLMFLWAHWCGDCKQQVPIIEQLQQEYGPKGLTVIGPTQYYGYAERGREVEPAAERQHIEKVLAQHYAGLKGMPVPISGDNFKTYGVSTTPTLVLVDRAGIVRLYNPGELSYEVLSAKVQALLR